MFVWEKNIDPQKSTLSCDMICGGEQGLATNICEGMKGNKKGKGFIDLRGATLLSFYHTTYNMAISR